MSKVKESLLVSIVVHCHTTVKTIMDPKVKVLFLTISSMDLLHKSFTFMQWVAEKVSSILHVRLLRLAISKEG